MGNAKAPHPCCRPSWPPAFWSPTPHFIRHIKMYSHTILNSIRNWTKNKNYLSEAFHSWAHSSQVFVPTLPLIQLLSRSPVTSRLLNLMSNSQSSSYLTWHNTTESLSPPWDAFLTGFQVYAFNCPPVLWRSSVFSTGSSLSTHSLEPEVPQAQPKPLITEKVTHSSFFPWCGSVELISTNNNTVT